MKRFKRIPTSAISACVLSVCTLPAHAGLISGAHSTDGGKTVALQGLEWMSLEHTANISRNTIEDANGFTDRYGTTWASDDWRYATRVETETLLGSLWGGVYDGWSADNADGAKWFINNFGGIAYDRGYGNNRIDYKHNNFGKTQLDFSGFYFGLDGDCSTNKKVSCEGIVYHAENYNRNFHQHPNINPNLHATNVLTGNYEQSHIANQGEVGRFIETYGLNAGRISDNAIITKSFSRPYWGSILVRNASSTTSSQAVSEPQTIALFSLGLLGLGAVRKRKKIVFS